MNNKDLTEFGRVKAGYIKPKATKPASKYVCLSYNEVVLHPRILSNMAYGIRTNMIKAGSIKSYFQIIPVQ